MPKHVETPNGALLCRSISSRRSWTCADTQNGSYPAWNPNISKLKHDFGAKNIHKSPKTEPTRPFRAHFDSIQAWLWYVSSSAAICFICPVFSFRFWLYQASCSATSGPGCLADQAETASKPRESHRFQLRNELLGPPGDDILQLHVELLLLLDQRILLHHLTHSHGLLGSLPLGILGIPGSKPTSSVLEMSSFWSAFTFWIIWKVAGSEDSSSRHLCTFMGFSISSCNAFAFVSCKIRRRSRPKLVRRS